MTLYFSPQGKVEELEEAVGEAEVAEAEAGRVARESHPALVVDVRPHLPTKEETSSNSVRSHYKDGQKARRNQEA